MATIELVQVMELVTTFTDACGTAVDEETETVAELLQPDEGFVATNV
jgi:hypothetical protein